MIYRDEERGSKITLASCSDLSSNQWDVRDLTDESVGMWEPSYDRQLWDAEGKLHIYMQQVEQADAEGLTNAAATPVSVLQWEPDDSR